MPPSQFKITFGMFVLVELSNRGRMRIYQRCLRAKILRNVFSPADFKVPLADLISQEREHFAWYTNTSCLIHASHSLRLAFPSIVSYFGEIFSVYFVTPAYMALTHTSSISIAVAMSKEKHWLIYSMKVCRACFCVDVLFVLASFVNLMVADQRAPFWV